MGVSGAKANKKQKTKQQLTLTEGGEGGPSVGVSGAKRIKTNQSAASDPAVDCDVASPRVNLSRNCWTKMPTIDTVIAKERAVYESVLMHQQHRTLGNKVSLACCVAHANGYMSASLVTLPAAQK